LLAVSTTFFTLNAASDAAAQTRPYNPMRPVEHQSSPIPAGAVPRQLSPDEGMSAGPIQSANARGQSQWRSARRDPMPMTAPVVTESAQPLPPPTSDGVAPESIIVPPGAPENIVPGEGHWDDGMVYEGEHGGQCCDEGCGDCCGDDCGGCGLGGGGCFGLGWLWPRDFAAFGGVQGFKGPVDQGQNGNFGFHTGFNLGGMLRPHTGLAYQFGAQFVHSNLSGDNVMGNDSDDRMQYFMTTGLFHRAVCGGLQGGAVLDLLYDDYYVNMRLSQIRAELSYVGPRGREIGFMLAASTRDDLETIFGQTEVWEATDQYAFFYRRTFESGGFYRLWAGFTGSSDGLVGGDAEVPLSDCFALQTNFNYLIPDEGSGTGASEEAWGLGINLVWYPGHTASCRSLTRPLFNVADNASFLVDRR
jgi:hypothetical protein